MRPPAGQAGPVASPGARVAAKPGDLKVHAGHAVDEAAVPVLHPVALSAFGTQLAQDRIVAFRHAEIPVAHE